MGYDRKEDEHNDRDNGTTIDQQMKAVRGEVQAYVRSMTWHDHQRALDDAVRSLQTIPTKDKEIEALKDQLREHNTTKNKLLSANADIKRRDGEIEELKNRVQYLETLRDSLIDTHKQHVERLEADIKLYKGLITTVGPSDGDL